MKKYISPEASVLSFETEDVITVSAVFLVGTDEEYTNNGMTVTHGDLWS